MNREIIPRAVKGTLSLSDGLCQIMRGGMVFSMAHTIRDKKKLLARIRRIQGQLDGVSRALEQEDECSSILQTLASCRGALNGLMAQVIEGHVRLHVLDTRRAPTAQQAEAVDELLDVVRTYLR